MVMTDRGVAVKLRSDLVAFPLISCSIQQKVTVAVERVFTPQKLANATNQTLRFSPESQLVKHLPAHRCSALPGWGRGCVLQVRRQGLERSFTCSRNQNRKVARLGLDRN